MFEQPVRGDVLYIMFYAGVAATALLASCYLLLRRGNAFAADVTSPVRLRRWTAAFFASITLCHVWYLPIHFFSRDDLMLAYFIAGLIDSMTFIPLTIVVLFSMLQDRRRPLWPIAVMMAPIVIALAWCIVNRSYDLRMTILGYFMLMWVGLIIYMIRAIRQYGRWLRDNYADLEHKEVWKSFVVLGFVMVVYSVYTLDEGDVAYEYAMESVVAILVCYLLWRVETLSDLSNPVSDGEEEMGDEADGSSPLTMRNNIGPLLERYCEKQQLYLQYNISAAQLAKMIGTNRLYLSQYFTTQGITYNTYINGLRIRHFIKLYQESAASPKPKRTSRLAYQCGFRSYSTFSTSFKQVMGMTPTEWMRNND